MIRPVSIIQFERCYLTAFVLGATNTVWTFWEAGVLARGLPIGTLVGTLLGFAITLSILYFVARQGSAIARWAAVAFLALGLIGVVVGLVTGYYPKGIHGVIGIVTTTLQAVSVWLMFRADAEPWFHSTAGEVAHEA